MKIPRRTLTVLSAGFLFFLALSGIRVSGQQVDAQMRGAVTDASGSAIPDAQVTATNTQTGVVTMVPSKADGSFQFLQLPVGGYSVTVTKSGFNKFEESGITLTLNQVFNLPVQLQVGNISTAVEVAANAAQVETSTTQVDTLIEAQKIVDLPLNGRNWVQLQQLVPGVVSTSDRFGSNFATNGAQSQQNSFLINGADSIDLPLNSPSVIPSPDAIAEFNLIDSTINAEYGRNSGGVLNAIIKSGTNRFRGDAFDFYRDTFLDGRNIYETTKPVYHQNQFGGTLGGPIWKDHTFFFLSYQGTRFREPEPGASGTTTVYTQAQRSGTFPDIANASKSSAFPLLGDNGITYPTGTPYSTIFSQGTIPAADMNPLAVKLLNQYVPLPNSPGGLYSFNPTRVGFDNQGIARIDHTFGPKDNVWVSLLFEHDPYTETLPFTGSSLPGFGDASVNSDKEFTADWTHTLNATTLNEFRISYLRFNDAAVEPQQAILPSSYGFNITPQNPAAGLPFIGLSGYFNLGFSTNGPQPRLDETYELADNFSKVIGNHTVKFGFDGKRYNVDNPFFGTNNGNYTFGGAGAYSTGDAGADFLLGIPDSYSQGSGGWIVARTYEYYAFLQDSWKVNQNLTLNYGVGYQIDTPMVNQHFGGEDINCWAPGQQSTIFPTAPAGLLYPGDTGCTASGYHNHYDHIGPRFGFAYSPGSGSDKSFVVRGGFGVYFNRTEEELTLQNLGAPPFSLTSVGVGAFGGTPSFANPFVDISTGQTVTNPFPFTPATKGSNVDFGPYEPLFINTISPNFTAPYAMNFNLNLQKSLPGAILLQVGYFGALGHHLELTYEGNPISPAGTAACAATPNCVANSFQQQIVYPSHTTYAPGNVIPTVGIQATDGNSNYSSLQVKVQKSLTHGLSFLASYTWSHSLDDTSSFENSGFGSRAIDTFNFHNDYGDSVYDARQRFVISYDYELPHLSRLWDHAFVRPFDGWHVAGITTLQSGFPITFSETDYGSLECSGYQYYGCWDAPNINSNPSTYNARNSYLTNNVTPSVAGTANNYYYFNPNALSLETPGVLGNAGRNNFHGPGINNTDLNLSKRFYIDKEERRSLELRLEAYNLFNHTQFTSVNYQGGGVDGNIYDANFGRVLSAGIGRTVQLAAKFYF